ncbi:MAG TPA: MFS transporter [Ktedonobacteraceae bacterium]|nr:MFS transporter [Ktedonobacteraceae bacterium]
MFTIFRNRNFALLWVGQFVSTIGDLVLIVALPFFVYHLTGSVLQTGIMFIVETLPRILLGSISGVFVDRWNRRWTMIISDVLRAGFLLLLLFVNTSSLLWLIYVVACIQAIVSQFFAPAYSAITPTLVDEQQITAANSLAAFSDALNRFIGPPLGGVLLGLFGLASVVLIDSASFLFSALMVLLIALPPRQVAKKQVEETRAWLQLWREWLEGLALVKRSRVVLTIFIVMSFMMLAQGIINVVMVVFVQQILHGDASTYGLLITTQGIGTLIGSFLAGYASKVLRPAYLIGIGLFIGAGVVTIFINIPSTLVGLITLPVMGIFVIIAFITIQTLLQQSVADQYRGRIFGSFDTTISVALLIGLSIAGSLGDRLGSVLLLNASCALIALGGLIALLMLADSKVSTDQSSTDQSEEAVNVLPDA